MFSLLKGKLLAAGAVVIAILLGLVKFFASKAKREARKADKLQAELQFKDDVEELDNELSSNYQPHRAEIVKANANADDDETFDVLSDPDSVRVRK